MSASRTEPEDGIKSVWNCSTSSPRRGSAAFKAVGNVTISPWTHLSSFFLLEMKQNRVFLPSKVSTVSDFYYRNVFSIFRHFYVYKVLHLIKTNTKWKKKNKIRLQGYNFCEVAATHWFSILNGLFLRVFLSPVYYYAVKKRSSWPGFSNEAKTCISVLCLVSSKTLKALSFSFTNENVLYIKKTHTLALFTYLFISKMWTPLFVFPFVAQLNKAPVRLERMFGIVPSIEQHMNASVSHIYDFLH